MKDKMLKIHCVSNKGEEEDEELVRPEPVSELTQGELISANIRTIPVVPVDLSSMTSDEKLNLIIETLKANGMIADTST